MIPFDGAIKKKACIYYFPLKWAVLGIIIVKLTAKKLNCNLLYMKSIFCKLLVPAFLLLLLVQCKKDKNEDFSASDTAVSASDSTPSEDNAADDSIKNAQKKAEARVKPDVDFSAFIFTPQNRDSLMKVFNKQFSEKERYTILALNRLDSKNKGRADTLAIPKEIDTTLMSYSPFPYHLDILNDVKKFVVFSYPIQAYGVYSNGNLVKWGPTSMGKKSAQTKRGLMFANWKKELSISTVSDEWKLPYNFNIHNTLGIGWHEYALPGYPASHSCLRLLREDAKWLYKYADQWVLNKGGATVRANGTPVIVFGDYKWGAGKPWKQLARNMKANDISEEQMNSVIEPHLTKILEEQKKREEVLLEIQREKEAKAADSADTSEAAGV